MLHKPIRGSGIDFQMTFEVSQMGKISAGSSAMSHGALFFKGPTRNSRGRQDPGSVTGGVLRSYHGVLRVFFERLRRDLQALSEVHNISASSCLGESWTILSDPTGVKRPTWHHGQSACSDLGRYRELLGRRYMHNPWTTRGITLLVQEEDLI